MTHRDPNRYADRIVFWLCLTVGFILYTIDVYNFGKRHGESIKVCAAVQGQQVVSTTAEVCTYAASYGRATKKRNAI